MHIYGHLPFVPMACLLHHPLTTLRVSELLPEQSTIKTFVMARDRLDDEELNAQQKNYSNHSPSSSQDFRPNGEKGDPGRQQSVVNLKLQNPLSGMSYDELMTDVEQFAKQYDLEYALDDLQKGALVSQNKSGFENFERLTAEDKTLIRDEKLHRWRQPKMMYYMTSTPQSQSISPVIVG